MRNSVMSFGLPSVQAELEPNLIQDGQVACESHMKIVQVDRLQNLPSNTNRGGEAHMISAKQANEIRKGVIYSSVSLIRYYGVQTQTQPRGENVVSNTEYRMTSKYGQYASVCAVVACYINLPDRNLVPNIVI
jgi:hypothetical protein